MSAPIAGFNKPYHNLTILDFQDRFPNEKSCGEYLLKMRWPDGCSCPKKCASKMDRKHSRTGDIFQCRTCKAHISTLNGMVQADEIFIGGKQARADLKASGTNKTPFFIGVEEDWKGRPRFVTFEELEAIYDQQIISAVSKKIAKGSTVKSDGSGVYQKIGRKGFKNLRSVYTKHPAQTAEHLKWVNMLTSNLKRFLLSTYSGVFPKYRDAYLAEFAYRFNRRYWPHQAFDRLLFACINTKPTTLETLRA